MDKKVLIALHKPYRVPSDDMYIPLHVGAKEKPMFFRKGDSVVSEDEMYRTSDEDAGSDVFYPIAEDDVGDNISEKNPYYCELTGLYYAYKNWKYDALGLVHYRRYFKSPNASAMERDVFKNILTGEEADDLLQAHDIIVPKRRNYYIESLYTHYAHTHEKEHLLFAARIIQEMKPAYYPYVSPAFNSREGFMFNMFIMKKDLMDSYFDFMFPVLFELEDRLTKAGLVYFMPEDDTHDAKKEADFKNRMYGRVSEILFNVWFLKEAPTFTELPMLETEKTNWIEKGTSFVNAKFFGQKYTGSF